MFDVKKLKKNTSFDNTPSKDGISLDTLADNYDTFTKLSAIIQGIMGTENTFDDVLNGLSDGLDEVSQDKINFVADRLLTYLGVSESAFDDLTTDNVEVAAIELDNLADLIATRMGDSTLNEFITLALHNPSLDTVEIDDEGNVNLDSVTLDWSFYPNMGACKTEYMGKDADGKPNSLKDKKMVCLKGFSRKEKGFWRYPKNNGAKRGSVGMHKYKNRVTNPSEWNRMHPKAARSKIRNLQKGNAKKHAGTVNATPDKEGKLGKADVKRQSQQKLRDGAGMKTFAGLDPDGQANE